MGHRAGWLALGAGIAGGADVILLPEIPYDVEKIAEAIRQRSRTGKHFSIVAVAEGAMSIRDAAGLRAADEQKQEASSQDGTQKSQERRWPNGNPATPATPCAWREQLGGIDRVGIARDNPGLRPARRLAFRGGPAPGHPPGHRLRRLDQRREITA